MSNELHGDDAECRLVLAALARGGAATDWEAVERHLSDCRSCGAGLARLTDGIAEQFAASRALAGAESGLPGSLEAPVELDAGMGRGQLLRFPNGEAIVHRPRPQGGIVKRSRRWDGRVLAIVGAAAAAVLLVAVVVLRSGAQHGATVVADRRPEFVPSLSVLPERADHTYYSGEQIQVCLRINQPSRVHLSVLVGHSTFDLYDADSDAGQHCFPEQIRKLTSRATLRVEVFYGAERVAREDFPLLPAQATPSP